MKNNFLTIKEFSLLTHTPIDTLKHYDRINLLKPAYVGENSYRYYRPEQTFLLTRILFGVKAKMRLADIRTSITCDDPEQTHMHYKKISKNIDEMIADLQSIKGTINNLEYYYNLVAQHGLDRIFSLYLPEWFVLSSPKLKLDAEAGSIESNIVDSLFIRGFHNGKWPHYLLGCMYTEADINSNDFSRPIYCLKVDNPEIFNMEEITFVPGGDYYCLLLKVGGKGLRSAVSRFLELLYNEKKRIEGNIFVMDVVNNFFTSKQEYYCTLIYAHVSSKGGADNA